MHVIYGRKQLYLEEEYSSLSNHPVPIKFSSCNIKTIINVDDRQPFVFVIKE